MKHNLVVESVRIGLEKYNINNCSILVALSGGADSVCLLHCLLALADEFNLSLSAAHVNHMLRGDEAERDEQFAKELCSHFNIICYSEKFSVKEIAQKNKQSIEEAGRDVRYSYFKSLQDQHKIDYIATAHHQDDNIETVVMRFLRGSGIRGLSGISFINDRNVIRPLLNISKNEILSYIENNALTYVTDSSNESCEYHRNKIRNELIPQLEELNPGFKQSLARNIVLYQDTDRYIKEVTLEHFNKLATVKRHYISFLISDLNNEPDIFKHYIISLAIQKLSYGFTPDAARIFDIEKCLSAKNSCVSVGKGISAYTAYDKLYIVKEYAPDKKIYSLGINAKTNIPDIGCLTCREVTDFNLKEDKNIIYLSNKNNNLSVRFRKDGDAFYPAGFGHKKSLQDFFVDNKIPRFMRDKIPLVLVDNDIAWVCGYRKDERFIAPKEESKLLEIIFTEDI